MGVGEGVGEGVVALSLSRSALISLVKQGNKGRCGAGVARSLPPSLPLSRSLSRVLVSFPPHFCFCVLVRCSVRGGLVTTCSRLFGFWLWWGGVGALPFPLVSSFTLHQRSGVCACNSLTTVGFQQSHVGRGEGGRQGRGWVGPAFLSQRRHGKAKKKERSRAILNLEQPPPNASSVLFAFVLFWCSIRLPCLLACLLACLCLVVCVVLLASRGHPAPLSLSLSLSILLVRPVASTHTHTHTHISICVCVLRCVPYP
jgi:hypothetical protein